MNKKDLESKVVNLEESIIQVTKWLSQQRDRIDVLNSERNKMKDHQTVDRMNTEADIRKINHEIELLKSRIERVAKTDTARDCLDKQEDEYSIENITAHLTKVAQEKPIASTGIKSCLTKKDHKQRFDNYVEKQCEKYKEFLEASENKKRNISSELIEVNLINDKWVISDVIKEIKKQKEETSHLYKTIKELEQIKEKIDILYFGFKRNQELSATFLIERGTELTVSVDFDKDTSAYRILQSLIYELAGIDMGVR